MSERSGAVRRLPVLLVAAAVLVVSIGAGAYAGDDAATNAISTKKVKKIAKQQGKKQGKKQAKKQIKKKAPSLSVLSAETADSADDAKNLGGTPAAEIKDETQTFSFSLTDGETETIATSGPLTMKATCEINEGGQDIATIAIDTSVNNAAGDGATSGADPDLDIGEQITSVETTATGNPLFNEGEAGATAPDGSMLMAAENHLLTGANVHGVIGSCYFSGAVVIGGSTA